MTPTHIHLIIQFEEKTSCGWIMQNINGELAKAYNRLYGRRGHMWRESPILAVGCPMGAGSAGKMPGSRHCR